jgi:hypothetical protein
MHQLSTLTFHLGIFETWSNTCEISKFLRISTMMRSVLSFGKSYENSIQYWLLNLIKICNSMRINVLNHYYVLPEIFYILKARGPHMN